MIISAVVRKLELEKRLNKNTFRHNHLFCHFWAILTTLSRFEHFRPDPRSYIFGYKSFLATFRPFLSRRNQISGCAEKIEKIPLNIFSQRGASRGGGSEATMCLEHCLRGTFLLGGGGGGRS